MTTQKMCYFIDKMLSRYQNYKTLSLILYVESNKLEHLPILKFFGQLLFARMARSNLREAFGPSAIKQFAELLCKLLYSLLY
jgi:hypothetical protein